MAQIFFSLVKQLRDKIMTTLPLTKEKLFQWV
jgi:hypothetical protein